MVDSLLHAISDQYPLNRYVYKYLFTFNTKRKVKETKAFLVAELLAAQWQYSIVCHPDLGCCSSGLPGHFLTSGSRFFHAAAALSASHHMCAENHTTCVYRMSPPMPQSMARDRHITF